MMVHVDDGEDYGEERRIGVAPGAAIDRYKLVRRLASGVLSSDVQQKQHLLVE